MKKLTDGLVLGFAFSAMLLFTMYNPYENFRWMYAIFTAILLMTIAGNIYRTYRSENPSSKQNEEDILE